MIDPALECSWSAQQEQRSFLQKRRSHRDSDPKSALQLSRWIGAETAFRPPSALFVHSMHYLEVGARLVELPRPRLEAVHHARMRPRESHPRAGTPPHLADENPRMCFGERIRNGGGQLRELCRRSLTRRPPGTILCVDASPFRIRLPTQRNPDRFAAVPVRFCTSRAGTEQVCLYPVPEHVAAIHVSCSLNPPCRPRAGVLRSSASIAALALLFVGCSEISTPTVPMESDEPSFSEASATDASIDSQLAGLIPGYGGFYRDEGACRRYTSPTHPSEAGPRNT